MAKQNKGRKFFAASATAALVASAIVPVASAAQLNDFNKISGYAKEAVQSLVDAGVIQGDANGNFNPLKTISRAEAATIFTNALELEAEGAVDFKDVKADAWYYDAIAATVENGIFEGVSATEFAPNKQLTRSEAAKILVDAFGLEGEGDLSEFADASTVKPWAKSYLEIAVANGVIKGSEANGKTNLNPNAPITRQDFAVVFSRTVENVDATPKVDKIEVVDAKTLNVTLSDGTKETVTLEKALEPNKETEVTFKIKDVEYKAKVTYVVTTATAVKSVSATNLKEITVEFDGKVDKTSAEDVDKYSVDSSVELESATLLEDGKTVRLTVKPASNGLVLQNQKAYKLTVRNVKAGEKFISASNVAFTPVDNTLPEVSEVKALGTKAVKVTFSEPVKTATAANFKLDGKSYFGSVSEGSRSVILKPYTSTDLAVGSHKLEVTGVEDFAGFKSLTKEFAFDVVEDTVAPKVKSVSATLEKVTVTFSEEVDPDTVVKSNVYWKSGTDKKAAGSVTQIAPDVYEFDFTANALPGYEMSLFVEGVKDYSGNQITETEVKVRAEVDQTRPEVSEVSISKLNSKNITVKFNKTVKIEDTKYFTLTDKDGKTVAIRNVVAANGSKEDKVFTLETYNELSDVYTLKIVGVRDTTKLQNTMNDYTATVNGKDTTAPKYTSNSANGRTLIINFNEKMDLATLADSKNYLVTINNKSQQLPSGTEVTPVQDGKAVRIVFPEYIDNAKVGFNDSAAYGANITKFKLLALKDVAGNIVEEFGGADLDVNTAQANIAAKYDKDTTQPAKMTAKGVIKVRFNQPIGKAAVSDFEVLSGTGVTISSVTTDGSDLVTINLTGNLNDTALFDTAATPNAITLAVKAGNKILTTSGNTVVQTQTTFAIKDAVKPEVKLATGETRLNVVSNVIELPFTETLGGTKDNYRYDLEVTNVRTGDLVPVTKYDTLQSAGNVVKIKLDSSISTNDEFKVSVKANAQHIVDAAGNEAVASATYSTKVGAIDTVAPTLVSASAFSATNGNIDVIKVTFSKAIKDADTDFAKFTGYAVTGKATVAGDIVDDNVLYLTLTTPITGTATTATKLTLTADAVKDLSGNLNVADATGVALTDAVAATVTTKLPAVNVFTATGSQTLVFSEELNQASKDAVKAAVDAKYVANGTATVSSAWGTGATANTLTVTFGGTMDAGNTVVSSVILPITVTDLAGNTSATLSVQQ